MRPHDPLGSEIARPCPGVGAGGRRARRRRERGRALPPPFLRERRRSRTTGEHLLPDTRTEESTLASLTAHTTRRFAVPDLRRAGLLVGGILLIVGFGLIIYALHFGTTL